MLRSLLFASTASAQAVHESGTVRLRVFNTGSVGACAGFQFFGRSLLFDGQLFVGTSAGRLSGEADARLWA